jgi:hypothetical protein
MSSDFFQNKSGITIGMLDSDPVDGINGDIYYNTTFNKLRKFENGSWSDLDTSASGSSTNFVEFVSGVNNWTVPAGINKIFVLGIGGGGGGTGGNSGYGTSRKDSGAGGGGGDGAVPYFVLLDVTPGETLTITIGIGGTGGTGGLVSGTENDPVRLGNIGFNGGSTLVSGEKFLVSFLGGRGAQKSSFTAIWNPVVSRFFYYAYNAAPAYASERISTTRAPQYLTSVRGGKGGDGAKYENSGQNGNTGVSTLYHTTTSAVGGGGAGTGSDAGAGGGGGGGNGLGIGGSGGKGGNRQPTSGNPATEFYRISQLVRANNITTLTISNVAPKANISARKFNVGEYVYVSGLASSYNGWHTVISSNGNQMSYYNLGADETIISPAGTPSVNTVSSSRKARFQGILNGMREGVRIEAISEGATGNSISLTFNGTDSLQDQIDTWNTANPSNQAWVVLGDPNQVPWNGQSITLSGGNSNAYTASGGNGQTNLKAFGSGGGGGGGGASNKGTTLTTGVGRGGNGADGMSGKVTIIY